MKRSTQQASYDQKKNELELKRIEREKEFEIQKLKTELQK